MIGQILLVFSSLLRCKTKAHFKNYQKGKKEIIEKDISDKDPEFKRRKKKPHKEAQRDKHGSQKMGNSSNFKEPPCTLPKANVFIFNRVLGVLRITLKK